MDDRLITVRTFDNPVEAHMAKNRLEVAGLFAFLADEITAGMARYLSTAVGGIKLQTVADDAERAAAILSLHGPPESADDILLDETPSIKQNEINEEESREFEQAGSDEEGNDEPEATAREQNAERAFRSAILSMLFFPIQFYVLWLLLRIIASDQNLRSRYRFNAWMAPGISALFIVLLRLVVQSIV